MLSYACLMDHGYETRIKKLFFTFVIFNYRSLDQPSLYPYSYAQSEDLGSRAILIEEGCSR
ncbi:MAG: hypothetical protein ABI185_02120 [Ginsengibacter sp.]